MPGKIGVELIPGSVAASTFPHVLSRGEVGSFARVGFVARTPTMGRRIFAVDNLLKFSLSNAEQPTPPSLWFMPWASAIVAAMTRFNFHSFVSGREFDQLGMSKLVSMNTHGAAQRTKRFARQPRIVCESCLRSWHRNRSILLNASR
jgi:hypothetical protein